MWSCTFVAHCDVLEVLKSEIYANKWFDKICDELVVASVTNLHCLRWRFCNALCDEEKVTRGIIMKSNTFPNIIKKRDTWPNKNVTCGWTVWCHVSIHGGAMSASKVAPHHPPACHHMPRQLQAWPCHVELPLMTDLVINYDVNILSLKIVCSMTKSVLSLKSSLLWRICRFCHGGINVTAYAWRMSFHH